MIFILSLITLSAALFAYPAYPAYSAYIPRSPRFSLLTSAAALLLRTYPYNPRSHPLAGSLRSRAFPPGIPSIPSTPGTRVSPFHLSSFISHN